MKRLTTYISHMKDHHSLNEYLSEKLVINKNYNPYTCAPKSFDELKKIIKERYNKLGPGTEKNPINFNDVDVIGMTTFYDDSSSKGIFYDTKFEYIDISEWDVSSVEDMSYMFFHCTKLKSVGDLSNWNVSKVENMRWMFGVCEQLKSVGDLSNWDVSNVKNMNGMFFNCKIKNTPGWYRK